MVEISPSAVSRWLKGQQGVEAALAIRFAKAVGDNPLSALVAAGYLTAEEAKVRPVAAPDFSQLTNDELLELVRQRMGAGDGTSTSTVTSMTGSGRSGGREVPLDAAARRTGRASRGQVLRDAQDADAET